MKNTLFVLLALSGCGNAVSGEGWERKDTWLLSGALTMTALDWAQTRYIARHPNHVSLDCSDVPVTPCTLRDNGFREKHHPRLPQNPTVGQVDKVFAVDTAITLGVAWLLPATPRRYALGGVIVGRTYFVLSNHKIGIGIDF